MMIKKQAGLVWSHFELISEIGAKNIIDSEVINLLIRPTIQTIKEQEALIKQSPLSKDRGWQKLLNT
jgi:hypothetical protein